MLLYRISGTLPLQLHSEYYFTSNFLPSENPHIYFKAKLFTYSFEHAHLLRCTGEDSSVLLDVSLNDIVARLSTFADSLHL